MKFPFFLLLCVFLSACASLKTSSEYVTRGNGYLKDAKHQQAIKAYNQALALNPNNLDAYEARGAAYYLKGQYDRAVVDFEHVLSKEPYRASLYTAYASVLAAQGRFEEALIALNASERLRPNHAETYFARGGVYYMLGQYPAAVADYTRTLQLRVAADVLNARANAYLQWGYNDLAERDFKLAKQENMPQHLNGWVGLEE